MTATSFNHHPGFGPGGCLPPDRRFPLPWPPDRDRCHPWPPDRDHRHPWPPDHDHRCPWPHPDPWDRWPRPTPHDTLPDSDLDPHDRWRCGPWWREDTRGYGLDLDGDGRYTAGRDGVLAFDFDRDGQVSDEEIRRSNEALKAFGGNYDLDGDGRVSPFERMRGEALRRRVQHLDRDRDGTLSTEELASGGARVVVDHDRDGHADRDETYSVYSFPGPWGGRRRLEEVDPWWGSARTTPNWPWWRRDYDPILFAK